MFDAVLSVSSFGWHVRETFISLVCPTEKR